MNVAPSEIRPAQPADLPSVLVLLADSGLPVADLTDGLPGVFFVAEEGGQIVGVAGVERLGEDGLLRSLAVAETARGSGLGRRLVESCEVDAQAVGLANLYLLTTSADAYFARLGYRLVPRGEVPVGVACHAQFRSLCPASAKCLHKGLAAQTAEKIPAMLNGDNLAVNQEECSCPQSCNPQ